MKLIHNIILCLILVCGATARASGEKVIPLYEGAAPGSEKWTKKEGTKTDSQGKTESVWNVSKPTLTFFPPAPEKAAGTAVIICPGGAFIQLAVEHEGDAVARFLAARGIACFVLRYRTVQCDSPSTAFFTNREGIGTTGKLAVEDGRAALKHVRARAREYGVSPGRVGLLGFSAGGLLTMAVATEYTADTRPAFAAVIYGAFDPEKEKKAVLRDAPPLFLAAAGDDFLFGPASAAACQSWLKAGRTAELHLYAKGGHGFGMKKQNLPSDTWCDRFADWLKAQVPGNKN